MAGEVKILLDNIKNFRKGFLNEGVGAGRIEDAINAHEVLYIYYVGDERSASGYRTIKPFVIGDYNRFNDDGEPIKNNGEIVVRAWQDAGNSYSYKHQKGNKPRDGHEKFAGPHGQQPGWRLFKLRGITSVMPTGIRFNPEKYFSVGGVQYNPNDSEMTAIKAAIQKGGSDFEAQTKNFQKFFKASAKTRDITKDEVEELLQIVRQHRKEAYRKFWVVELENGGMSLKTEKQMEKQNIPDESVVGNLKDLYNKFIVTPNMKKDDDFFKQSSEKAEN